LDSLVAIDIETTGLDPENDAIIEIAAVRFNLHRIEKEWSTLINPGRRIPPFITNLTSITDQMVLGKPTIRDVLPDLSAFVGRSPVVGHNVRFDLGFLRRHGVLGLNDVLDTYEMAAVLLPNAGRYALGPLAQSLGVPLPATHRALDDARATWGVFARLYDEALRLPVPLLAELVRLSEPLDSWGGFLPLQEALRARSKERIAPGSAHFYSGPLYTGRESRPLAPLNPPAAEPAPLDIDEVAAVLEQGGAFSRHFPHYEYRVQQIAMLRSVCEALSQGRHLLVEAGTGTGKSVAYLIPAAAWAIQNGRRVVISTNTINLQDQLINKDIPDIRAALGIDLRAVVVKGRSNYLCPRRLEHLRKRGPETADEMRVLGKTLVWLQGTQTGDRSELNINGPGERQVWARISAEDDNCSSDNCLKHTGGACPFYRVRQAAQSAHILIVNHALLLADVSTGNRVLPEYDYLIVDEAHHMENAVTNALSFEVHLGDIERAMRELGGPKSGVMGRLLTATQHVLQPAEWAGLNQSVQQATDLAFRLQNNATDFFYGIDQFLTEQREGRPLGQYAHQERILPATRTQPEWSQVETAWEDVDAALRPLNKLIETFVLGLAEINDALEEEDQEIYSLFASLYRRMTEIHDNLTAMVFKPLPDRVYWVEANANGGRLFLKAAPVHIGGLMEQYLWNEKQAVIMASATLTTASEFDYIRGRLNAAEAYELALGSPFDFETAAMLYLVNDIPEPSDRSGHQRAVETALISLCKTTGGRALVLFTSYDQLKRTSQVIGPALAKADVTVYEQGEGASPHSLLETFRSSERAVLLGTRSFWEGVDVPGDALSVLVIVKLPFDVPSDPIIAARSETFEDPFNQYSIPEAILKFRQGFGRLIRTAYDRGIVVVLDKRLLSKRYGKLFIDSLPPCTVRSGPLANLPGTAKSWLNL
jgi:DNA polymerase-3 subunit epsilon/ATP-dependent DNA helicase DinG